MGYFESLLEKRQLSRCLLPLWKLKITDEEYMQLREELSKQTRKISNGFSNPFITMCKEAALFFSEYWRREYVEDVHSKEMVYKALKPSNYSYNEYCNDFYEAAQKGAKQLRIEFYDGGRADPLNSMLYQGGLPMRLVTQNNTNSVWDRFTRGLINKKINFDELNLGIVATQSQSLRDFCNQLIMAIEAEQFMLMPFYCQDCYNGWFVNLIALSKQEKQKQRQLHPFSLDWEFRVDQKERKIFTKYVVKGSQKLPPAFLKEEGLENTSFFSMLVKVNGKAVDAFDYLNGFCRYPVVSNHPYKLGDNIWITIQNNDMPHLNGSLDMSIPHILYMDTDGLYRLGNHIGERPSLLLIAEGWNVQNEKCYNLATYKCDNIELKGIIIDADFSGEIIVSGIDGEITFGANAPMYWTELYSSPIYIPDVEETLYNAKCSKYKLCFDTEEGIKSISNIAVKYRSKWQDHWSDKPDVGQIYVRAIDPANHFVTPMQIINIGEEPVINLRSANQDTCEIQVSWKYGQITINEGIRKIDNVWQISKNNCLNKNRILLTFIPEENSRNQFTLSLRAPFKEFAILDTDENSITSNVWIPYTDLDKYQYHLVGQDIREYSYGRTKRELRWYSNKLYIIENGVKRRSIPYEGCLLTLFDSRESVRALLDRTSQNMLNAQVSVSFIISNTEQLDFDIKDSPFRPRQTCDGKIEVTSKGKQIIDFRGSFKLLKLDDPSMEPEILSYNEDNGYVVPDKIREWGKCLLIGQSRGRICPTLIDLNREMTSEYRKSNRDIAIATISDNINHSSFGDSLWQRIIGWFYRIQKEDIPASSLLELYCVAQNADYLIGLAFQLYAQCSDNEERDTLANQLISISGDLAFQWYWLSHKARYVMSIINRFVNDINNQLIKKIFIQWSLSQGENTALYIGSLSEENEYQKYIGTCLNDVLCDFEEWLKSLCVSSMLDNYGTTTNEFIFSLAKNIVYEPKKLILVDNTSNIYVEINQDFISESAGKFFIKYNEKNLKGNEQWMYKRINAVVANLRNKEDLFAQSDEIRRSIIFCSKSCNEQFIIGLNNKLIK
jgi:hypothetical protein